MTVSTPAEGKHRSEPISLYPSTSSEKKPKKKLTFRSNLVVEFLRGEQAKRDGSLLQGRSLLVGLFSALGNI